MAAIGLFGGESGKSTFIKRERLNSGRSLERCCSVERRREEERLGIVAKLPPGRLEKVKDCVSVSRPMLSDGWLDGWGLSVASKMLKSGAPPTLCRLRRFAEGLANSVWSRLIAPSVLFRGLTAEAKDPKLSLRRFSIRLRLGLNAKLLLLLFSVGESSGNGWRFSDKELGSPRQFSFPVNEIAGGVAAAFP